MAQRYIEFLKQEDFNTAKNEGSVEINGETLTYSEENLYLVPDTTEEQIADLQAEQAVQSAKITTVEESVKKYYRHIIHLEIDTGFVTATFSTEYISTIPTRYTTAQILDILMAQPIGCIGTYYDLNDRYVCSVSERENADTYTVYLMIGQTAVDYVEFDVDIGRTQILTEGYTVSDWAEELK